MTNQGTPKGTHPAGLAVAQRSGPCAAFTPITFRGARIATCVYWHAIRGFRCPDADEISIPKVTIPQLLQMDGFSDKRIDLLKCDIEGAEADVFTCGAAWIPLLRYVSVETHPPLTPDGLLQLISAAGVPPPRVLSASVNDAGLGLVLLVMHQGS